ncbi:hypothetical protein Cni_G02653 [Canna indica]|uniref:BED-type domain-containing protein n=1 Tax=Canna indica TaxID=4628 RepID=A0AAQ3Q2W7_9LILI|nr:hypothetical protein Cni_G02653 [Canna indica]
MAPKSAPTVAAKKKGKKDIAWEHCVSLHDNRLHVKCNYCPQTMWGGTFRVKHHLAGTHQEVAPCLQVPEDVALKSMFASEEWASNTYADKDDGDSVKEIVLGDSRFKWFHWKDFIGCGAERALFLWNNDHIVSLIAQNRSVIFPIIFEALEKNMRGHWNQAVRGLTANVRKMFLDMDSDLFEECQQQYIEKEEKAKSMEEQRELAWKNLESLVESKGIGEDMVLAS